MNQELTASSILSLFDTTKAQTASFADKVMDAVNDGHLDPLKLKVQLKAMEDIITQLSDRQDFKEAVTDAAAKYGRGRHEFYNAVFEVKATAGRYDYSADAEHNRLKSLIKARENFLKTLPESMDYVSGDGEVCKVQPAKYTPGADTVFVTLK